MDAMVSLQIHVLLIPVVSVSSEGLKVRPSK